MSSNSNWAPRTTGFASVRTWVRTPFGSRSEQTAPTRPRVEHGHEIGRSEIRPLV
jgi:hypothetical protein